MKRCPLYYRTIYDFCASHNARYLITVNHNLFFSKNNTYYCCHYHKVNNQYIFEKETQITLDQLFSLVSEFLEGVSHPTSP